MNAIFHTEAGNPENQDRGAVIRCGAKLVLVVADGAGGRSGGAEAAKMAVDLVRQEASILKGLDACINLLEKIDQAIAQDKGAGETTCVVVVVSGGEVYGASVGDSGAFKIGVGDLENLTQRQSRKPFLGSGSAIPVSFGCKMNREDKLLLATDGLLKYTSLERIENICRATLPETVAKQLVELVRYPSGSLPDDIAIIFAST